MEAFIIYLIKASGLTGVFFLAYSTLLKKETFFTSNRMFLLAGLITSALLPFLVYTKIVWITPQPVMAIPTANVPLNNSNAVHHILAPETFTINWFHIAIAAYTIGVLFFTIHLLTDLHKVIRMLRNKEVVVKDGFKHIDSASIQSPFSFFKYIVYNSANLQPQELQDIIAHEKVHSGQNHSLDVFISQLFCIIFWFNPFAWLYKKAISQNLEFIADAVATKHVADRKAYQITLLKITMQPECIAIINHFYQSLIKKRIVMLNKEQSKRSNAWKYALIVPALTGFVLLFQVEVVAQEKSSTTKTSANAHSKHVNAVATMANTPKRETSKAENATAVKNSKSKEIAKNKSTVTSPIVTSKVGAGYAGDTPIILRDLKVAGVDYKKAHIIINDKIASVNDYEKLDLTTITKSTVAKGTEAVKLYGRKADGGIIIIETKGFTSTYFKSDAQANVTAEDINYFISKNTTDNELELYVTKFKQKDIKMQYSDAERNNKGELTSLKVELSDRLIASTGSAKLNSTEGIPIVAVGRKDNKISVVVSSSK